MRIGFDVSATCSQRTGVGWYADSLVHSMASIAPENEYILFHRFDRSHHGDPSIGTQLPEGRGFPAYENLSQAESEAIWEEIRRGKAIYRRPDIVHAASFQAPPLPGTRLVYTVFDVTFWVVPEFTVEVNRAVSQRGTLDAMKNAQGFLFISESARDEFDRVFPDWLTDGNVPNVVTPLGTRGAHLQRVGGTPKERNYWLFVGALEPRKNLGNLLKALELYWAKSRAPKRLKLAGGDGCESQVVKEKIAELQSRRLLEYLNYVPDEQLPDLYEGAIAFVFPSWYEGFGLPILEAMSAGCPVITSDNTSLPEVGGDAALYVDPHSPESIADAMLRIEEDPILAAGMAEKGLRRAREFTWEKTARLTLDFYEEVLSTS